MATLAAAAAGCWLPLSCPGADEAGSDLAPLTEIVVTARKIEEDVQDVPMSIQVLSGEFLDDTALSRLYELQFNVPGLVVNNAGMFGGGFSLRGVAGSMASHLNGVYLGNANLAIARVFDLERVEVLKGPQGTLYGRNASSGSVNFITRPPDDEPGAAIQASYGSFATRRIQGHVDAPADAIAFRLSFTGSEGDGYIRNSVDDRRFAEEDFWGLRGSLRVDFNDDLRLDLMAQHLTDDGASGELWTPNPAHFVNPGDIRLTTVRMANPFLHTDSSVVTAGLEYDLGPVALHSVSGYARSEVVGLDDCAGLPALEGCVRGVRPQRYEQWSQEFRLSSRQDAAVSWQAGIYGFANDGLTNFHFTRPQLSPMPINDNSSSTDEVAYAVFGQSSMRLNDRWRITGGLRFSAEQQRITDVGTGSADHQAPASAEDDSQRPSWRIDLEYTTDSGVLVYGGIATGFKSGGITTTVLPNGEFNRFDAEQLIAYEAGIKGSWPERRLTLNAAAFYYDFSDMQISSVYLHNNRAISEIENAGRAEIYGVDASGYLAIGDKLVLHLGFVWLPKREFVEFRSNVPGIDYSANELVRAPEWTIATALEYARPLGGTGVLTARAEYNYRSDYFFTAANEPDYAQEAFGLLNILLKFEPAERPWHLFAAGRNLTDEDYFNQVFLQSSPGYPDTYELGIGYRF